MQVLILGGGKSVEHEVSLVSAAAIAENIDRAKHTVLLADVTRNGRWVLANGSSDGSAINVVPGEGLFVAGEKLPVDVVFPALHGTFGEDGTVQGLLESAGVACVGCGVLASALAMDKEKTKLLWAAAGLPVVPGVVIRKSAGVSPDSLGATLDRAEDALGYPLFVKPVNGGSSVGSGRAADRAALEHLGAAAFEFDHKVLVEKAIDAREVECAVTGDAVLGTVTVWGAGEIVPAHEFYDYDAKYIDPKGAAFAVPPDLDSAVLTSITGLAKKAYALLDCSGLARVDFFVSKSTNDVYLNEANTMPGFTPISMFPKICVAAGLSFTALIDVLLDQAKERFLAKSALHFQKPVVH
jgi:D-alanine-D-alanine ligase